MSKFTASLDLGKLVVRSIIGNVMKNGMVQISMDLFNYQQVKQSLASEKPDIYGNTIAPNLQYKVERDGSFKVRTFVIHGETVHCIYNKSTYKPEFFMDSKRANAIHEPWLKVDAIPEASYGFSI